MCSILPLVSVTTSAWDFFFFFFGANWNNLASSANMNESQAFREAVGLHSAAAPYWAIPLYTEKGMDRLPWGQSHQKWHPLSAMRKPAASTCCCTSINQWLWTDSASSPEDSLNSPCVPRPMSLCRNVDVSLQSVKVAAVERGSWDRTDPASWLLGGNGNQLSGLVLWFQSE